jgi:VCBS repeat-containing protein
MKFPLLSILILAHCGQLAKVTATSADNDAHSSTLVITPDEHLGTLTYGQSASFTYQDDGPRYDTYDFQANDGDNVAVTVTSSDGGTPDLWLLDMAANNGTLARATDGSLTLAIPHDGSYLIAVRDADFKTATFNVQLAGTATAPTVFDATWCSGDPMSVSDGLERFAIGATSAMLGTVQINTRTRQCQTLTGCGAWSSNATAESLGWAEGSGFGQIVTTPNSSTLLKLNIQGAQGTDIEAYLDLAAEVEISGEDPPLGKLELDCGQLGSNTLTCTVENDGALGMMAQTDSSLNRTLTAHCFQSLLDFTGSVADGVAPDGVSYDEQVSFTSRF